MKQLVSVIIPCYNVSKYIERALKSVEEQDYSSIEIICIDDGSEDNTLQVIDKYANKSNLSIRLLTQKNEGVSSARNRGIDAAEGEFLLFLDGDDLYAPHFISSLVEAIGDSGTAYNYRTNDFKCIKSDKILPVYVDHKEIMDVFMYRKKPISFTNFLYRTNIINKYSIRFDTDLKYGEDILFFWKYFAHISSGYCINQPMYWYYQNPSSAQHNVKWNRTDAVVAIDRANDYLRSNWCIYYKEFSEYMPYRMRLTVLLDFARDQKKELYDLFYKKYNISSCMNHLINKNGIVLSVCAIIAKYNGEIFYRLIGLRNHCTTKE